MTVFKYVLKHFIGTALKGAMEALPLLKEISSSKVKCNIKCCAKETFARSVKKPQKTKKNP